MLRMHSSPKRELRRVQVPGCHCKKDVHVHAEFFSVASSSSSFSVENDTTPHYSTEGRPYRYPDTTCGQVCLKFITM